MVPGDSHGPDGPRNDKFGRLKRKGRAFALPKIFTYQQPKPQIRLRICQMELQPLQQLVLQLKKYILPTSLSDLSREDKGIVSDFSHFFKL